MPERLPLHFLLPSNICKRGACLRDSGGIFVNKQVTVEYSRCGEWGRQIHESSPLLMKCWFLTVVITTCTRPEVISRCNCVVFQNSSCSSSLWEKRGMWFHNLTFLLYYWKPALHTLYKNLIRGEESCSCLFVFLPSIWNHLRAAAL